MRSGARWLSIVGIGEDGATGLSPAARALITEAEIVFGGRRHLALAGDLVHGQAFSWPSPFEDGIAAVLALRGRRVCVVASGDPFFYGVGATLARHVPAAEMRVMPAPSAFSLAAARLGWALQDVVCLSVHGRAVELIRPHLHPGRHILVLTSDGEGPAAVARLLARNGFGASKLHVLEALGGARERVRSACAADLGSEEVDALNLVGIEVVAEEGARIVPLTPGLPDDCFENDGQLTKRDIRAVTLAVLAPRRGELLWDIGAGAGSVAIEWMLADPSLRAVAVEEGPCAPRGSAAMRGASACPGSTWWRAALRPHWRGCRCRTPSSSAAGPATKACSTLPSRRCVRRVGSSSTPSRWRPRRCCWRSRPRSAGNWSASPSPMRRQLAPSPAGGRPCRSRNGAWVKP